VKKSGSSSRKLLFHETQTYAPPSCPDDGDGDRLSSTADFLGHMSMDGGTAKASSPWSEFVGLTCAYNENAPCDVAECAMLGTCPDHEIQNQDDFPVTGSCVFPHIPNDAGKNMQCSNPAHSKMNALRCALDKFGTAETTSLGCKFQDNVGYIHFNKSKAFTCAGGECDWNTGVCAPSDCSVAEAECAAHGGKWFKPASNQAECDAHGSACFSKEVGFNGKDMETCKGCGEEFRPFYQFNPAKWSDGIMRKHSFTTFAWGSKRQWGKTVVIPKFYANLESIVSGLIGRLFVSAAVSILI
jgi:hypothetical protein